jgi:glycosyltransferase involved in cell wall biosynthesis
MPRKKIKVSILLASYNTEKYIKEAIKSILKQDFKETEILVTDDGSSDNTYEILKKLKKETPKLKIFKQRKNQGKATALNRLLPKAKGEYLIFFDSDDIMYPERIRKQVLFLDKNPNVDALYGNMIIFWEKENKKNLYEAPLIEDAFEKLKKISEMDITPKELAKEYKGLFQLLDEKEYFPSCSIMIRKKVIEKGIKFDPYFKVSEDADFWFQLIGGKFVIKKQGIITYIYRRHSAQVTVTKKEERRNMVLRAIEKLQDKEYFKIKKNENSSN